MSGGGIRAEWLVECSSCGIDVEPGRWYNSKAEAMQVRNRAVHSESWVLTTKGDLICPDCAEGRPRGPFPGAALIGDHLSNPYTIDGVLILRDG
jgi:hypothetical protein